jgi:hypothetical protein
MTQAGVSLTKMQPRLRIAFVQAVDGLFLVQLFASVCDFHHPKTAGATGDTSHCPLAPLSVRHPLRRTSSIIEEPGRYIVVSLINVKATFTAGGRPKVVIQPVH